VAVEAEKYPAFRAVVNAATNHPSAGIARSRQQEIHKEKTCTFEIKAKG